MDGGYSPNIRINDHAGKSSEISVMLLLRSNAMQANTGNVGERLESTKKRKKERHLFVFLLFTQICFSCGRSDK